MDNNIHINQYDSMSSTGSETPSPGAAGLTSLHFEEKHQQSRLQLPGLLHTFEPQGKESRPTHQNKRLHVLPPQQWAPVSARHIVGLQASFQYPAEDQTDAGQGDIDLASHTVTEADEAHLLSNTEDLDYLQSPEFLTEAFLQFRELLEESLGDQNDVQNILHYLDKMVKCDPTFDYRNGRSSDGTVTGFVWQTGVMRRDFELYGDVLFVDCMGKSINTKGWPINTIAMLDCNARRRKKHILSCLQTPVHGLSQHLYDYDTSP
ncbi:hypothetical protein IV203_011809 [Nitzschia inconspicua]|uniref:Uncharacterized protein n=1 Tax=Nitzschia inconspicua TaxID=303405 RepID=A0A9K3PIR3_9STRA|nr:hypothetical protein IV203_011809 [Nitzschia inconspicua]